MRSWPVPIQMESSEERIIGGFMTLRQLGYLIAGACLGGLAAALPLPAALRLVAFLMFLLLGAALAFAPACGMPLDVFLFRLLKWRRSRREMSLRGDD
ncbi:MAG: PrgI family mobile element protein [Thermacetogeniaceae bacterium]